ncbi:hypothetical protein PVAND_017541 [Polypedilum vanderplanki]|nr:hypothetical protein PVAND_017541 [Polypedilum vanderplanki]
MNQTEIDIERHVLSQTKKLSDGTFEKIFIRNPRGENGFFSYNCRLCGVANLNGERSLQTHITGRKHQQRLYVDYIPDAYQFRAKATNNKPQPIIYPGEPIPPGFEDEMPTESYLSSIIMNVEKPLIGLEYVVELLDSKAKEPLYVCILCDKRCDPRNIIAQVTSHRHRMKYLDFHFPALMKILNVTKKFNLDMAYREEVLTHISRELETLFGRQKLPVFEYKDFEKRKTDIMENIKKGKHFSEDDFPNSEKILLEKFKIKENQDLDEVSSNSEDDFKEFTEKENKKSVRFNDKRPEKSLRDRDHGDRYGIDYLTHKVPTPSTSSFKLANTLPKRFITPRELQESSNQKMQEQYIVEKYKTTLEYAKKDIENKYKQHERNPENHPKYSEEWKEFWARRYRELIAEGKDANSYDYRPEWINFWTRRVKELYDLEIEAKKKEIQKKLKMTPEQVKKIELDLQQRRSRSRSRSPPRKRPSRSPIEISDESSDDDRPSRSGSSSRRRRMDVDDDDRSRSYDSSYRRSNRRDRSRSRSRSVSPEIEADKEINLVTVCRLLSVLETELGILAPKIIELLSRGLAMEKSQANSCDNLLLTNDNMILMETAKEKLKGGLSAGLIAKEKVSAVKKAIMNIAKLIFEVNERKPKMIVEKPKEKVNVAPSSMVVDRPAITAAETARLEIARVIAAALAEQGKEDLPAEELEALIESFLSEQDEEMKEEKKDEEVKKTKEEKVTTVEAPKRREEDSSNGLENLTDDDLKTLLRNFSELTSDEQNHLIAYLSKIERTDAARVEKLRKYVDIGDDEVNEDDEMDTEEVLASPANKKSPIHNADLSDDDYPDDPVVPMKDVRMSNQISNPIIANPTMLANDLMSSLEASMPMPIQQQQWDMSAMQMQQGMPAMFPSFEPVYSTSQIAAQQEYYNQQMEASLTANPWPQTSAATFMSEDYMPNKNMEQFRQHAPQAHVSYKKRIERTNNLQLTGKGAKKK